MSFISKHIFLFPSFGYTNEGEVLQSFREQVIFPQMRPGNSDPSAPQHDSSPSSRLRTWKWEL